MHCVQQVSFNFFSCRLVFDVGYHCLHLESLASRLKWGSRLTSIFHSDFLIDIITENKQKRFTFSIEYVLPVNNSSDWGCEVEDIKEICKFR